MVQYLRYPQLKKVVVRGEKGDMESQTDTPTRTLILEFGNGAYFKRTKPKLLPLLFFFSFVACVLIFLPRLMSLYSLLLVNDGLGVNGVSKEPLCSSVTYGSICCDRSSIRSDICFMKGDVRTNSASFSILLVNGESMNHTKGGANLVHEKIRPYTRKWEASVMGTIDELDLIVKKKSSVVSSPCDVQHSVPAVVFSTGGYTGNVYHEFNDGLIPLYITSQHYNKNVVFVVLEYHDWWMMKYDKVVSQLSNYPLIDFNNDKRTHCFPEATVGLRIHDELTINSSVMQDNKSIRDFRNVLDRAFWPRIQGLMEEEAQAQALIPSLQAPSRRKLIKKPKPVAPSRRKLIKKPKLVILSRNGSRAIINQHLLVELAEHIGFEVEVIKPEKTTEMAKMYRVLNSSDAMIGVHGAAMTHFLFMKPGSVFIQVIPLGTDWAAETYYGEPSRKLGLKYIGYKILPRESSLYKKYNEDDPVLRDPDSVNDKGWEFTKKIYLDGQNVDLDLERFKRRLVRSFNYTISRRKLGHS